MYQQIAGFSFAPLKQWYRAIAIPYYVIFLINNSVLQISTITEVHRFDRNPSLLNTPYLNWNSMNYQPVKFFANDIESYSTIKNNNQASNFHNLEAKLALNDHDNLFSL